MKPLDCIAFIIIKDNKVLAEKRKLTKKVVPGKIALPGGHIKKGESPENAVIHELKEEIGVNAKDITFVCTLLHKSEEFRKLNYFIINSWEGEIKTYEAEALLWIPLQELDKLDLDVDRTAIKEYLKIYKNQ